MKYHPGIINENGLSLIEDTYLLAALMTFEPSISCKPRWNESGKVVFEVLGPISDGMRRYFAGEQASLSKYASTLKFLRSSIFAMRKSGGHHCKGVHESFDRSVA